jgi:hypothetical protein
MPVIVTESVLGAKGLDIFFEKQPHAREKTNLAIRVGPTFLQDTQL